MQGAINSFIQAAIKGRYLALIAFALVVVA